MQRASELEAPNSPARGGSMDSGEQGQSAPSPRSAYQLSKAGMGGSWRGDKQMDRPNPPGGRPKARLGMDDRPPQCPCRTNQDPYKPAWANGHPQSPSRSKSMPRNMNRQRLTVHSANTKEVAAPTTPSAVSRIRSQSSPRQRSDSVGSPRALAHEQDDRHADIETPAKVSVSSMVGRFAMPTASSQAKRSPKRPQASKSFFSSDNHSHHDVNREQESAIEASEQSVEPQSRCVIETPDKVSVADMKGLFAKGGSKPVQPSAKPFARSGAPVGGYPLRLRGL